jgi:hypothetical protein
MPYFRHLILTLQIVIAGCHSLTNRLEVIQLECGDLKGLQPTDYTFIKGIGPGDSAIFRDTSEVESSLRVVSLALQKSDFLATTKGCLAISTQKLNEEKRPFRLVQASMKLAADVQSMDFAPVKKVQFSSDTFKNSSIEFQCSSFATTASNVKSSLISNIKIIGSGLYKVNSIVLSNPKSELLFVNNPSEQFNIFLQEPLVPISDEVYSVAVRYIDGQGQNLFQKIKTCQVEIDSADATINLATSDGQLSLEKPLTLPAGKAITLTTDSTEYELSVCPLILLPCRQIKSSTFSLDEEGEYTLKGNFSKRNGTVKNFRLIIKIDKTPPYLVSKISAQNAKISSGLISRPLDDRIGIDLDISDNFTSSEALLDNLECAFSIVDGIGGKVQPEIQSIRVGSTQSSTITLDLNEFRPCGAAFAVIDGKLQTSAHTPVRLWYGKALKFALKVKDTAGLSASSSIVLSDLEKRGY